jgi:hypothetical protein
LFTLSSGLRELCSAGGQGEKCNVTSGVQSESEKRL